MTTLLADYEIERNLFQELLADRCSQRILLFRGASGTGKTTLLKACLQDAEYLARPIHRVPIQFRDTAVTVAEIFYRLGDHVGWNSLKRFVEQVASLQGQPSINIEKNRMLGQNQINVALSASEPADRAHRRAALTDAWFGDLRDLRQPLLLIVDTYEKATTELRDWIDGPFLARVARVEQVRVLVAGQEVPDPNNIEWGAHCRLRDLYGVHEAGHWMPLVEQLNRQIDVPDPLSWLAGICHALKGRPQDIMQVIENLPERKPPA